MIRHYTTCYLTTPTTAVDCLEDVPTFPMPDVRYSGPSLLEEEDDPDIR